MRKALVIMVLAGMTLPVGAAQAQSGQPTQFCLAGRGCVPSSPQRYNACFELALQRGLNVSRGDRHNMNKFLYDCLSGRVRR